MSYTVEELERMVELVNGYNGVLSVYDCIPMKHISFYLKDYTAEQVLSMVDSDFFNIKDDYFDFSDFNNSIYSFNEENKKELYKNGEDEIFHTYYDLVYEGKIKDEFDLI